MRNLDRDLAWREDERGVSRWVPEPIPDAPTDLRGKRLRWERVNAWPRRLDIFEEDVVIGRIGRASNLSYSVLGLLGGFGLVFEGVGLELGRFSRAKEPITVLRRKLMRALLTIDGGTDYEGPSIWNESASGQGLAHFYWMSAQIRVVVFHAFCDGSHRGIIEIGEGLPEMDVPLLVLHALVQLKFAHADPN